MTNIKHRLDLGPSVGPKELRRLPIHRWFVYPHSFSASLINEIFDNIGIDAPSVVWDPFVGAGTTMVTCRQRGLRASGTDILPLSIVITQAKVSNYETSELETWLSKLARTPLIDSNLLEETDISLLKKAFPPEARCYAQQIRRAIIGQVPSKLRPFFLTALVNIYHLFGSYIIDGGWPRLTKAPVKEAEWLFPDFLQEAEEMIEDVRREPLYFRPTKYSYTAHIADFRRRPRKGSVDAIITSPPYLNKHDYTRLFAPELSLLGLSKNAELTKLRYSSLRSHVEAKPNKHRQVLPLPDVLCDIISIVRERANDHHRVSQLISGYFEDLFDLLRVCSISLKNGGYICIVVSNVQFAGTPIPVDEILPELANRVNLRLQEKWLLRWRGNSSQQMAKYGRNPVGEWVLIWQKE